MFDALPVGLPYVHARRFDTCPLPGAQLVLEDSSKVSFFRSRPNHSGSPLSRLLATVRSFCFLAQVDFIYAQLPQPISAALPSR